MEQSLHHLLRTTQSKCHKDIILKLATTGLGPGQPKVLEFLAEHAGCEQKDIALGCDLDPATVTGILGRLEQAGLIERTKQAGNRRSLHVFLTSKGLQAEKEVEDAFHAVDSQGLYDFSKEETTELFRLLKKVSENLQKGSIH